MNYFQKFNEIEAREGELEVKETLPDEKEIAEFIKRYAKRVYADHRDDPFLSDHCTINKIGGGRAYHAVLAARLYLGEKIGRQKFEHYKNGFNDEKRHDRKFNHLIRWTYDGSYFLQYKETALDYFLNIAFDEQDEAEQIIEAMEKMHAPDSKFQSEYFLLALSTAGRKKLVERSLEKLIAEQVLINNFARSPSKNMGGHDYWQHSISFERNIIFAMVYHNLGDYKTRDKMLHFMQTWSQVHEGVCWESGVFDLHPDSTTLNLDKCSHKDIDIEASSLYLELLKLSDKEAYAKSRARLMQNFIDTFPPGYDEKRSLPFRAGISEYFMFFTAAQPAEMFPK